MKKILVVLALAAFASTASAAIANGAHDLNSKGGVLPACQYCHAAHLWTDPTGGATGVAPLWNRNSATSGDITPYTSDTFSPTAGAGAVTLACLSCHDGVSHMAPVNGVDTTAIGSGTIGAGINNVGLDLSNDHPVGFQYPATGTELIARASLTTNVKLYGAATDQVECGSCHDPHGLDTQKFLRDPDICGFCHTK